MTHGLKLITIFLLIFLSGRLHHWNISAGLHLKWALGIFGRLGWLVDDLTFLLEVLSSVVGVQHLEHLVRCSLVRSFQQHVDVNGEFDGVAGRARSKVVLTGLESISPRVEVHRGHL